MLFLSNRTLKLRCAALCTSVVNLHIMQLKKIQLVYFFKIIESFNYLAHIKKM